MYSLNFRNVSGGLAGSESVQLTLLTGPKSANSGKCFTSAVKHPSAYDRSNYDVSHQRGCDGYVSLCEEDCGTCHS